MIAENSYVGNNKLFGKSVKGYIWKLTEADQRLVLTISQKLSIPEILATIMVKRGVKSVEEASSYLDPKIKDLLPNPFDLKDMDKAAERIATAIINKEKITIFGDYDVDGATSSALLKRFFKEFDIDAGIYIPNRMNEGYGPNTAALKKLKDEGNTLVITVDCGIVSFEPIKEATEYGLEMIVLDHHLSLDRLPEAHAVVNPNRFDDEFPYKSLAAVGVAFFTTIAVRKVLRDKGYFKENKEPDLMKLLDLVALGTVCDVMNLQGINRAFVKQGLKLIGSRLNVGLATLANVARLDAKPQSYHLGFVLGPRINAGGRVGEGILGARLLATEDPLEAQKIATELERLNDDRRSVEALVLEEAIEYIESNAIHENPVILVKGDNWHQGILGILASRIKERYSKPAAVISLMDGIGKGSARSISGIDFGSLLAQAKQEGLLLQGGGHAMAGGFSVEDSKIDEFYKFLINATKDKGSSFTKAKEYEIDAALSIPALNGELVKTIEKANPFGNGNSQPKFALLDVTIVNLIIVGKIHFMVIIGDKKTDPLLKKTVKCMLFKALDTEIGEFVQKSIGKKVNLVGYIQGNINDKSKADFIIEDIAALE